MGTITCYGPGPRAGGNCVGARHRQRRCPPFTRCLPVRLPSFGTMSRWRTDSPTRKALASASTDTSGEDHGFAGVFCADECQNRAALPLILRNVVILIVIVVLGLHLVLIDRDASVRAAAD